MIENHRPILRSDVRSLPIERGWIVVRPKNIQKLLIADLSRIEFRLHHLCMPGLIGTDILITGFFFAPTGITDRRCGDAFEITKCLLYSPKAASAEGGF